MRSKIILGGRFRITDEGDFFRIRDGKEKPKKITVLRRGENLYATVSVYHGGVKKSVLLSHMVAEAFVPNPGNFRFVRHKDGNTLNNRADNLEWVSMGELRKKSDQSREIVHLAKTGMRRQEIAERFGISRQRVYQIVSRG